MKFEREREYSYPHPYPHPHSPSLCALPPTYDHSSIHSIYQVFPSSTFPLLPTLHSINNARRDQRTLRRDTLVVMSIETRATAGENSGAGTLDHFFFVERYCGSEIQGEVGR